MSTDDEPTFTVTGDDLLYNGMILSVRMRQDFTVTDADRLLATARRIYHEGAPELTAEEVAERVYCAADALFTILERIGFDSFAFQAQLQGYEQDGLAVGGGLAKLTVHETDPLRPGPLSNCFRGGDLFRLPPGDPDYGR